MVSTIILKEAILSLLKLGKNRVEVEVLAESSPLTRAELTRAVKTLAREELVNLTGGMVEVSPLQKAKLALKAVRLGSSLKEACRNLSWSGFERAVMEALELNGYEVLSHLRVRVEGKLSEIDVLALKGRLLLLVDCKHWRKPLSDSLLQRVAEIQKKRVEALNLPLNREILRKKMGGKIRGKFYGIPLVITLLEQSRKLVEGVPVVSISKLVSFLAEIPAYIYELKSVNLEFS